MPLNLTPVSIEELPKQERTSKWRDILEQFEASGQEAAQVTFEGETGRDDKPISASSASSGLSSARAAANGQFEHIRVSQRGEVVYLVNKRVRDANKAGAAEESTDES